MKNEEAQRNRLDEQTIKEAAAEALDSLQLDAAVKSVCADGDKWCVQFEAEYSQFCDGFRDQFGKENSFELIREKVKRHVLKQQQNKIRAGVRIRRGKAERGPTPDNLFETAVKAIEGIATQTADLTGEIINQAARLPQTALSVLKDAAQVVNQTSTGESAQSVEQPLARVAIRAGALKSSRKSSTSARQAAAKKSPATRKAKTKTATKRQRTTAKSTAQAGKKKGSGKKRGA